MFNVALEWEWKLLYEKVKLREVVGWSVVWLVSWFAWSHLFSFFIVIIQWHNFYFILYFSIPHFMAQVALCDEKWEEINIRASGQFCPVCMYIRLLVIMQVFFCGGLEWRMGWEKRLELKLRVKPGGILLHFFLEWKSFYIYSLWLW